MPKVSIIVPVYKAESYLDQCVKSVLEQTFRDFELILVDDESPDNCPSMCDIWKGADNRIKVIHQKNGGVAAARNAGLDAAQGEFVAFLDSDDFLDKHFLEKSLVETEKYALDMYIAGSIFWKSEEKQNRHIIGQPIACHCNQLNERAMCQLLEKSYISSCWGMLLRADYIKRHRFENGCTFGEDVRFVFSLLEKPGKMKAVPEAFYYYRDNPVSATKSFDEQKIEDVVATYRYLIEFARKKQGDTFMQMVQERWVTDCTYIQHVILASSQPFAVQYRRLKLLCGCFELRKIVLQLGNEHAKEIAGKPGIFLAMRGLRGLGSKIRSKLKIAGDK